jgi:Leucine-rich repeat (LRR) protein
MQAYSVLNNNNNNNNSNINNGYQLRQRRVLRATTLRLVALFEAFLLLLFVVLVVVQSPTGCDGALAASTRRRTAAAAGGGRQRGAATVRVVPCPGSSCRCRLTKSGEPIARCHAAALPLVAVDTPPSRRLPEAVVYAELILKRVSVTRLPSMSFGGLRATSLDLTGNQLETIADDAFVGSAAADAEGGGRAGRASGGLETSLEVLTLSECGLTQVPSAALSRLRALRVLRLDTNRIADLPSGVLSSCCGEGGSGNVSSSSSIRELYLYRNAIARVDAQTFAGLELLEKLSLAENRLEALPANAFAPLVSLIHLDLGRNRLHELAVGWTNGLVNLRWLELTSNRLRALERATFRGAARLRYMMVDNNELTSIEDGTFLTIRHLSYLSVDIGNVTALTPKTLAGLRRLKTLILGEMRGASLPGGFFGDTARLKYLSLLDSDGTLQQPPTSEASAGAAPGGGLRPELFAADFRFRQLNVWLRPIRACRCSEPWIRALGARGVYVHGYCDDERPLSCPAGGKAAGAGKTAVEGARGKLANGRFKSSHPRRR